LNDVKKYFFSVADGSKVFVLVVLGDGSLVNENVFVGVVSVDETVAVSDVEPFNASGNTVGDYGFFDTLGDGDSGRGIAGGLFDGIFGLFSVDGGDWLFLNLFGNFSGHLVVVQWFLIKYCVCCCLVSTVFCRIDSRFLVLVSWCYCLITRR